MTTTYDDNTLSAFMDGELDLQTMHEVDDFVETDTNAQQRLLGMVRKTALLKSSANEILNEPVPDRLLTAIAETPAPPAASIPGWTRHLRVAAVFLLMLVGYGAGMKFSGSSPPPISRMVSALPLQYQSVVGEALEYNISGKPLAWRDRQSPAYAVKVTPVRTYQDRDGKYFREYRMEMISDKDQVTIRGLAHRTGKEQWKTTALFF